MPRICARRVKEVDWGQRSGGEGGVEDWRGSAEQGFSGGEREKKGKYLRGSHAITWRAAGALNSRRSNGERGEKRGWWGLVGRTCDPPPLSGAPTVGRGGSPFRPAGGAFRQEAVSCTLWPRCTAPGLSGVKYARGIAGREQRELNSGNYNQVRA